LPYLLVSFLHNALRKLIRSSRYARIDSNEGFSRTRNRPGQYGFRAELVLLPPSH
jgi:hypothetical protein